MVVFRLFSFFYVTKFIDDILMPFTLDCISSFLFYIFLLFMLLFLLNNIHNYLLTVNVLPFANGPIESNVVYAENDIVTTHNIVNFINY